MFFCDPVKHKKMFRNKNNNNTREKKKEKKKKTFDGGVDEGCRAASCNTSQEGCLHARNLEG
jgi:ribosome assembly protein YihI (activator of Der GTPase)